MGTATGILAAGANLLANLLVLFGTTVFSSSETRLMRKIERDAALLKDLPEAAKPLMNDLITYEVQQVADRRRRSAVCHIHWGTLSALIFWVILSTGACCGFAYLAMAHGWGWWILVGIFAVLGLLGVLGSVGDVFYYGDKPPETGDGTPLPDGNAESMARGQSDVETLNPPPSGEDGGAG